MKSWKIQNYEICEFADGQQRQQVHLFMVSLGPVNSEVAVRRDSPLHFGYA